MFQQLAPFVGLAVLDERDREIEEQSGIIRRLLQPSAIGGDGLLGFAQLIEAVAEHAQDQRMVAALRRRQRLQCRAAIGVIALCRVREAQLIRGHGVAGIVRDEFLQRGNGLFDLSLIDEYGGVVNSLGARLISERGEGSEKERQGDGCAKHVCSVERSQSRRGFRPRSQEW